MISSYDLVIFDCDGVLVDSEALASKIWCDFLAEYGVTMSVDELGANYAGMTDGALARIITEKYGVVFDGNVPQQIEERANVLFDTELRAITGVKQVVEKVQTSKCVCTNSNHRRLIRSLETVGLANSFHKNHLFSARMVDRPKPAPDLHLFAASKMGIAPEKCMIIEDSLTGVSAGIAAGMTVYGFTGASHLGDSQAAKLMDAGAERVFHSMHDILDIF